MGIVFSCLQKWAGFSDGDFRDDGSKFQHVGLETANACVPYSTVLVCVYSRSPWVAARAWRRVVTAESGEQVTTGVLGPARADIWTQGRIVCTWFVCELVTSVAGCESSLRSRHDRTCATSKRVELRRLEQIAIHEDERQRHGRRCDYRNRCGWPLERVPVSWHSRQIVTVVSSKADGSAMQIDTQLFFFHPPNFDSSITHFPKCCSTDLFLDNCKFF